MYYKDLVIINNEKIYIKNDDFYCDNLDLKVLPEGLNNYFNVQYITRSSTKKGYQKINLKNIKVSNNIFKFIYFIIKTFKISNVSYLLISITPYTFLSFLILFLFRKRVFIYLFSSGHEEYKYILGRWSIWIYHTMYKIVTSNSKVIVCHERLSNKKNKHLVYISRLDEQWLKDYKKPLLDKPRFLYVGRLNPEKGIFEFLKMFDELKFDSELSIVGRAKNTSSINKKVKLCGYIADTNLLIKAYDSNNIMVLPSFTEATPYTLDESLSRKRPVIIFEDISYIVREKIGVFVSKRDIESFSNTTKYIMDNYDEIQKKMEKNVLPTKKSMIKQISNIIKLDKF